MKTKLFASLLIIALSFQISTAQISESLNAITSASSYVGTSNNNDVLFKRQAVSAGLLSTTKTSFGVNSVAMPSSVSFGVNAGQYSSGTGYNTYIGQGAGKGTIGTANSGNYNTFIGNSAGMNNTTGYANSFIGANTGTGNTSGINNAFLGNNAGGSNSSGNSNVYIGNFAGETNTDGNNNTFIGTQSGGESSGASNSVIIGKNAGYFLSENNKLIIDFVEDNEINNNPQPLIWGDFYEDQLKLNGKVGIGGNSTSGFGSFPTDAGGVDVSGYNLFVTGGILTEEVRVNLIGNWADYVFKKGYDLKPLSELEKFIADNGHLPNVPCAEQVKEQGIELGEMAKIQQEKIEELTLYLIQQNKEIEELKAQMKLLLERK